ncbi:MAG: hypothetical protein NTY93_03280 [Candidatus Kaiserbacteria bacterium]|nr:hypothetical protein [Candidatus Kaiserbacteria bacterium]
MNFLYRRILRPILFLFNADAMHELFMAIGEFAGRFAVLRWKLGLFYNYRGTDISKTVDGITYRTPILLSAGFDPNGRLTRVLSSLSFGGEEIGSITAQRCKGNPHPWFVRLVRNKSMIVYKGLANKGVDAIISKLLSTPRAPDFVLGISIARTNEKAASIDAEAGIRDYVESFQKLTEAGIGDYYAINISCPNAHSGEAFTSPTLLAQLLPRLREIPCAKPVYLKMPINIQWEQFVALADIADKNGIQGLIIGNANKNYKDLSYPKDAPKEFRGGLSGTSCRTRSTELIRKTREKYGKRFTIIGVGGILTPDDAMEKFAAGADLIQLITGMIYEGPGLIKAICERYAEERRDRMFP